MKKELTREDLAEYVGGMPAKMFLEIFLALPDAGERLRKSAVKTIMTAPLLVPGYFPKDTSFSGLLSDLFDWNKTEQGHEFWLLLLQKIPCDTNIDLSDPEPRKVTMAEVCEKFGERVVIVEGEEATE